MAPVGKCTERSVSVRNDWRQNVTYVCSANDKLGHKTLLVLGNMKKQEGRGGLVGSRHECTFRRRIW